jgi:GNS1/SUR4 family
MAQLTQFVSVIVYSACSMYHLPAEATWKHYLGYGLQVFEMSSLFVLFMHFYRKAYSQKREMNSRRAESAADSLTTPDTMAEEQDSISSESSTDE